MIEFLKNSQCLAVMQGTSMTKTLFSCSHEWCTILPPIVDSRFLAWRKIAGYCETRILWQSENILANASYFIVLKFIVPPILVVQNFIQIMNSYHLHINFRNLQENGRFNVNLP